MRVPWYSQAKEKEARQAAHAADVAAIEEKRFEKEMNREDPKVLESAAKLSKSLTEANEEAFLLECVRPPTYTNLDALH